MAQQTITADDFRLTSTWSCRVVYKYDTSGNFTGSTCTQSSLVTASNTVRFAVDLPSGAKVSSAKVHASHTTGLYGGTFKIAGSSPDSDGFVELSSPDFSAGYIDVAFSWTANTDGSTAHSGEAPAYNGSTPRIVVKDHESPSNVTEVYLLIETSGGTGYIYHAEDGVLVPYQLYHAEDGALVPYQLQHAEGGVLVPYG